MLPATYTTALMLTILSMLCWGSWANTMKLAGKWRFELFYFDYAFGVMLAATIAAFTFGSFDAGAALPGDVVGFSFLDNVMITTKKQLGLAVAGGIVFNLANMLLVAAISLAGLAVAFPIGIGLALIIGVALNWIIRPAGDPTLLFGGSFLVLLAILACAMAHRLHSLNKAGPGSRATSGVRTVQKPGGPRPASPAKGIALSLVSGIFMGVFYPLVEMSKVGDIGLGPYAAAFFFALGVLISTPVFNLFFMNLPVEGEPIGFRDYLRGTPKLHLLGLLGGVIWCTGAIANFTAASSPESVNVGPSVSYAIGQGATLVSTLWGLLVWKEFDGASSGVKIRLFLTLLLFTLGLGAVSMAPLYR